MRIHFVVLALVCMLVVLRSPVLAQGDVETDARRASHASALATVVPIAVGGALFAADELMIPAAVLGLGGIFIGPATGYVLTGHTLRALGGIAVRGGAWAAGAVLAQGAESEGNAAAVATLGLVGLLVGSVVYDVLRADDHVRAHATERASLAPWFDAHGRVGFALSLDAP
ncbi:MAG TPA: hypothetical protein VF039_01060 [Longimicrobiales bacterium]